MIEIKFVGNPDSIHESIQDYLDQARLDPIKLPARYELIESSSDIWNHIVTMSAGTALACTCTWFRHHHKSAIKCRHMQQAETNARA